MVGLVSWGFLGGCSRIFLRERLECMAFRFCVGVTGLFDRTWSAISFAIRSSSFALTLSGLL